MCLVTYIIKNIGKYLGVNCRKMLINSFVVRRVMMAGSLLASKEGKPTGGWSVLLLLGACLRWRPPLLIKYSKAQREEGRSWTPFSGLKPYSPSLRRYP